MNTCHDQKTNLLLDVYGELDEEARVSLDHHLETCDDCRQERQQILGLLRKVKTTMDPPELSVAEARILTDNIKLKLKNGHKIKRWWQDSISQPMRFIPALAATCILIVIVGIIGYSKLKDGTEFNVSTIIQAEQLTEKDLEIIRNLDLLKEMDAIQKLVRVVDNNHNIQPSKENNHETRGMRQNIYGKRYA